MDVINFRQFGVGITPAAGERQFQFLVSLSTLFTSIQGKYLNGAYVRPQARPTDLTVPCPDVCLGNLIVNSSTSVFLGDVYKQPLVFFPVGIPITTTPPNSISLIFSGQLVNAVLNNCSVEIDFFFSDEPRVNIPAIFK